MLDKSWNNPWKLTAIGMALVAVTAGVTGLVVANRVGTQTDQPVTATTAKPTVAPAVATAPAPAPAVPPRAAIETCNRYAGTPPSQRDNTIGVVKDAAVGAVAGAAVGAVGGAIADGGKGAGKGAAIGGILGAGGGTLYGVNEVHKNNQEYREAYARCMHARGYPG
jgi:hypothetical protein